MEILEADSREGDCKKASEGVGPTGSEADLGSEEKTMSESPRAEIDTSAQFESVKEAATRFGGMGLWRPNSHKPSEEKLFSMLKDVLKSKPNVDVVKLQKSSGVVSRRGNVRKKARHYRIKEYFYGLSNDFSGSARIRNRKFQWSVYL